MSVEIKQQCIFYAVACFIASVVSVLCITISKQLLECFYVVFVQLSLKLVLLIKYGSCIVAWLY